MAEYLHDAGDVHLKLSRTLELIRKWLRSAVCRVPGTNRYNIYDFLNNM